MRRLKIVKSITFLAMAGLIFIFFVGTSFGAEALSPGAGLEDTAVWSHVKAVWIPSVVGWLLLLQAPAVFVITCTLLWEFFQEQKYDHIYDSMRQARDKAEAERQDQAEEMFQEYVGKLSPELVESLSRERIQSGESRAPWSPGLKEVSALDFFIGAYRESVFSVLEDQIPLPCPHEEAKRNWLRYSSPWFKVSEAVAVSALTLVSSGLAAMLGYALVFV